MYENTVAKILFIVGVAQITIGLLGGIISGTAGMNFGHEFDFGVFFVWSIIGFTVGILCIGFAENIQLLQRIYSKMNKEEIETVQEHEIKQKQSDPVENGWYLPLEDGEKIEHYYKNETILDIVPSHIEGLCVVKLMYGENEFVRVVDIHGFGVQEIQDDDTKSAVIAWYNEQN